MLLLEAMLMSKVHAAIKGHIGLYIVTSTGHNTDVHAMWMSMAGTTTEDKVDF